MERPLYLTSYTTTSDNTVNPDDTFTYITQAELDAQAVLNQRSPLIWNTEYLNVTGAGGAGGIGSVVVGGWDQAAYYRMLAGGRTWPEYPSRMWPIDLVPEPVQAAPVAPPAPTPGPGGRKIVDSAEPL